MKEYNTIMFDLFFTLVEPIYFTNNNEFNLLNISVEKWEEHAEYSELYKNRIKDKNKSKIEIIEEILGSLNISYDSTLVKQVLNCRENRLEYILKNVDTNVLNVLKILKRRGKKLVLVSNADNIDIANWRSSPLSELFDDIYFSCEVGLIKPSVQLYEHILGNLNESSENCLFVGDGGDNELLGAINSRIDSVIATYYYRRENLKYMNKISYRIDSINDLLSIVR